MIIDVSVYRVFSTKEDEKCLDEFGSNFPKSIGVTTKKIGSDMKFIHIKFTNELIEESQDPHDIKKIEQQKKYYEDFKNFLNFIQKSGLLISITFEKIKLSQIKCFIESVLLGREEITELKLDKCDFTETSQEITFSFKKNLLALICNKTNVISLIVNPEPKTIGEGLNLYVKAMARCVQKVESIKKEKQEKIERAQQALQSIEEALKKTTSKV